MVNLLQSSAGQVIQHRTPLADVLDILLTEAGNGTGEADHSAITAPFDVKAAPPAGEVWVLSRMLLYLDDNVKITGTGYGGIATPLATGLTITTENAGGAIHDYTPKKIQKTGEWSLVAGVDILPSTFNTGNDFATMRWTFERGGGMIVLDGDAGEFLNVNFPDTLATLVSHYLIVQGRKYTK